MSKITLNLPTEQATYALAQKIAACATIGDVIYLKGTLGMGKSAFARAFIRSLSPDVTLDVPSPTFTLVQHYDELTTPVWHFDFYRLESPDEIEEVGLDEALTAGISLIEWPERLEGFSFANTLILTLEPGKTPDARLASLTFEASWAPRLKDLAL